MRKAIDRRAERSQIAAPNEAIVSMKSLVESRFAPIGRTRRAAIRSVKEPQKTSGRMDAAKGEEIPAIGGGLRHERSQTIAGSCRNISSYGR